MDPSVFFSQLKPTDYLQLISQLVSAGIALWSVVIARSAARTSSDALKDQRTALRAQHRSTYFRAVVLDPALAALSKFSREAATLVGGREGFFAALPESATKGELMKALDDSLRPFNALFSDLEFAVLTAVRAWGDEEILKDVGDSLQQLQDDVTTSIGHLIDSKPGLNPPVGIIRERTAELIALLVRYDREPFQESDSDESPRRIGASTPKRLPAPK